MEKQTTQVSFCVFLLVLALLSSPILSKEVDDGGDFDHEEGSGQGLKKWGDLNLELSLCETGQMQSPIDLRDENVSKSSHLKDLRRNYKPSIATIINRGHDVMVRWIGGGGSIQINGTQYVLQQCHWHSPSEHAINGQRFDLELHMVHQTSDQKIAVVAILYKIGKPDKFLSELREPIKSITNTSEEEKLVGVVDPNHIKIGSRSYYKYMGSLTTPPCTENVVWTVVHKVGTVSKEQVRLLRAAVDNHSNARPLQPLNNRSIYLYQPRIVSIIEDVLAISY